MPDVCNPAYESLRNIVGERTNRIVAWVGAGLSVPAGLLTWGGLRNRLCDVLARKADALSEGDTERGNRAAAARKAKETSDLWAAFSILKESLGKASYPVEIREALSNATVCRIPECYSSLWKLPLNGIITTNLDKLAIRSFSEVHASKALTHFVGNKVANYMHVLKEPTPFVASVHGIHEDESSWVFTHEELRLLLYTPAYTEFLTTVFLSYTVVFIGVSVDDAAVSGVLHRLKGMSIDFGSHYWITDRRDKELDDWAESLGVRVIPYSSRDEDHHELGKLLVGLGAFVPSEQEAPPVRLNQIPLVPDGVLEGRDLNALSYEELRRQLNARATQILDCPDAAERQNRYDEFWQTFSEYIHKAWYVSEGAPNNVVFGYTLECTLGSGGFGRVFRARSHEGGEVALKLLHSHILWKPGMLQSFRRGVRSMRILSERKVEGMVPYRDAGEIPAFAVMDFVDGPNLAEAVDSGLIGDWSSVLRISRDVARIIRSAHRVPERVLHRDIRPANIMLRGFWKDNVNYEVLVLDFDLSWHAGASEELSVSVGTRREHGYAAPEQLRKVANVSTRNAAVDSYGLGMTLLFLRSGRAPKQYEHESVNWESTLATLASSHPCSSWRSVPVRFSRLIQNATRERQAERWDMSQIEAELSRLSEAELTPQTVRSAELLAEELACRTYLGLRGSCSGYDWSGDRLRANIQLASGVSGEFRADESRREIELLVNWTGQGSHNYKNVKKYLEPEFDRAMAALRKGGWRIRANPQYRATSLHFGVVVDTDTTAAQLESLARGATLAMNGFVFN